MADASLQGGEQRVDAAGWWRKRGDSAGEGLTPAPGEGYELSHLVLVLLPLERVHGLRQSAEQGCTLGAEERIRACTTTPARKLSYR